MEILGMTVAELSAVSRAHSAGLTWVGDECSIVLALHPAVKSGAVRGIKIDALTLLSPEDARGLALALWKLAPEVERKNAAKAEKEGV